MSVNVNNTYSNMQVSKTNNTNSVNKSDKLSDTAQKYLDQLKTKYSNFDFIVADYTTDEEAQKYLATGKGEYNCVITTATLEKMATDENERAKYEAILSGAGEQFDSIKEQLGDNADSVKSFGISIEGNGEVSYFALLKEGLKVSDSVKAAREKNAEKKAENAEQIEKAEKNEQTKYVKASSVEQLVSLIKEISAKKDEQGTGVKDRVEFGKNDDKSYRIDRVEFGREKTQSKNAQQENIVKENKPFDFKA